MKRYRTALILAAALFGLGGLATWDQWKTQQESEDKKNKNRLSHGKPEDVVEVTYSRQRAQAEKDLTDSSEHIEPFSATIIKQDGKWRLSSPIFASADNESVDSLIKNLLEYTYSKPVSESKDQWREFGLEQPERSITLKFAETTGIPAITVFVGDKAPVGYNVYIRTTKADTVYLGSQYLLTSTSKTLFDLRDKSIVSIDEPGIKSLEYERKGADKIELAKAGGSYRIAKPKELDADPIAIRDFVEDLTASKAIAFVDSLPPKLAQAFSVPDYTVTWEDAKGLRSALRIVELDGKLFAATGTGAELAFELATEFAPKIRKDLMDFRNRRFLAIDVADARQVEIDGAKYVNSNGEWFAAENLGKPDAKEAVHIRALLVDLEFAKTDRFYEPEQVKSQLEKAPESKIEIQFNKADMPPVSIELFATEEASDKFLVRRSGVPTIYRVAKTALNSMRPSPVKTGVEMPETVELPDSAGNNQNGEDLGADGLEIEKVITN